MPISVAYIRHRRPQDLGVTPGTTTLNRKGRALLRRFGNLVLGAVGGTSTGGDEAYTIATSGSVEPAWANSAVGVSSGAGTETITINGVAVTAAYATSDTNTAGLLAAAVNSSTDPLVQGFVQASNLTTLITFSSTGAVAGDVIDICGTRFTAVSGAVPNYTAGYALNTFDISGSITADAAALCAAINQSSVLSQYVMAVPGTVGGTLRLFSKSAAWPTSPGSPTNLVVVAGATNTAVSSATLAAGAFVGITACYPGVQGNSITIAASGTGMTVLNSEARLARGTGLGVVPVVDQI